jgi:hypothetical protein
MLDRHHSPAVDEWRAVLHERYATPLPSPAVAVASLSPTPTLPSSPTPLRTSEVHLPAPRHA